MANAVLTAYRPALFTQLVHLGLCVVWNGVGLWQKSQGIQGIGPTASFSAIAVVLLCGIGLTILLRRAAEKPYLLLSVLGFALAGVAIYGGFTKDRSNWPSEFWRWAGIMVNAFGVIGFLQALATFIRKSRT